MNQRATPLLNRVQLIKTKQLEKRAFRTKVGLENKTSTSHNFHEDTSIQLKQVFKPNTWFCDLVNFGKYFNKSIGYFMFVHANSRYIILNTGNLIEFSDGDLFEFTPTGLKSTQYFIESLTKILSKHQIDTLITDFEPGWKSEVANVFYKQHNINHIAINVSEFGHRKLAILDRCVRTIRDVLFNLKYSETNPENLQKIIEIYNNTKHKTLTELLKVPTTPKMVFQNLELEQKIIQELQAENYKIQSQENYEIPNGTKVIVKHRYNTSLEKHRRSAEDGNFIVMYHYYNQYLVKNLDNGETKIYFRSELLPT